MNNLTKALGAIFAGLAVIVIVILILGFPTMWLWNWLMPEIFGLPTIGFWQAIGLMFLSYLILPKSSNSKSNS